MSLRNEFANSLIRRQVWRRSLRMLVFSTLLLSYLVAVFFDRVSAPDLAAASEDSAGTRSASIRLQRPSFGVPPTGGESASWSEPMRGLQIVSRQAARTIDGPVIESRQQAAWKKQSPVYGRQNIPTQVPAALISQSEQVVDETTAIRQPSFQAPGLRRTQHDAPSEPWSQPPQKKKSTPEETEKRLRAGNDGRWSHLPRKAETVPSEVNRQFQTQPNLNWSVPPQTQATITGEYHTQRSASGQPVFILPERDEGSADVTNAQSLVNANETPSRSPQNNDRNPGPQDLVGPAGTASGVPFDSFRIPGAGVEVRRPDVEQSPTGAISSIPRQSQSDLLSGFSPGQTGSLAPSDPVVRHPLPDVATERPTYAPVPRARGPIPSQAGGVVIPGENTQTYSNVMQTPGESTLQYAEPQSPYGKPQIADDQFIPDLPNSRGQYVPEMPRQMIPDHSGIVPSESYPSTYSDPVTPGFSGQPIYQGQPVESVIQGPSPAGHSLFGVQPGTSGFRATIENDAGPWMAPYNSRAGMAGGYEFTPSGIPALPSIPMGYVPWWDMSVRQSTDMSANSIPVDVSSLLRDAMLYSPQVTAIKAEPEVQHRVIIQESAEFDWTVFLDATYDDLNDPVGNELTTGNGQDRLITRKVRTSGGIRRRNLQGGEFTLAQDFGHENQNSRFFIPNNQASSRLELTYRQPLLDGAGRCYNESEIILARIRANSSEDEVVDALQDHLIEVTKAYWTLYRARAEYYQRQKLLSSANRVLIRLQGRSQVDTIPRQVLRATAAVARAQTRIQRTAARVKDAEAQLRLLVNSPGMLNGGPTELTPMESPRLVTETAHLQSVLQTALVNRPDISEAIRKMRASSVRLGVSRQELLPRLDFLVETYVADLSGNSNLRRAVRGQLYDNRPGYTVGLEFEYPLENRAARAKLEQRQWELKRSINVFRATVEKSLTDVEIANREVATAYSEMLSRYQSMKAAENEMMYLQDRFDVLPAAEDSAILLLEDLLDSYERIADEESSFVQAQVDHAVALVMLKKELGILLQSRHSRPSIEPGQQEWIDQRIMSATPGTGYSKNAGGSLAESTSPRTEHVGAVAEGAATLVQPIAKPGPDSSNLWQRAKTIVGHSLR